MKLLDLRMTTKTLWCIAIFSLALFFVSGRWFRNKVIDSDVISYYSYLPATFIEGDIKMRYSLGNNFYSDKVWGVIWQENSGPVQKYTMGLSWLYLPFFMLGHLCAWLFGYPMHGYSAPYNFWLQISSLFYLMFGLIWLRKVLVHHFTENISAVVMVVLAFGTNLFFYTQGPGAMPHSYLFALVSGLLWLTMRFWEKPSFLSGLKVGAICSLITLIRPNHLLLWLIPVFYGLSDKASIAIWWAFWKENWSRALIWPVVLALIVFPQMLYWKYLTGNWVHYSYDDESFFWADPKIWKVFFSFRNGWLIYTPVMLFALPGFFYLRKFVPKFSLILPFVWLVATYVIASWWCWWYGGSFGSRVFIDYYPMLALGLATTLTLLAKRFNTRKFQLAGLAMLMGFILLNLFQTFQYTRVIIHYDGMTAKSYFSVFGRISRPPDLEEQFDKPDYEAAKKGIR